MNRMLVGVALVFVSMAARSGLAGTYNFNFNNTEQGENGNASPTVNVVGAKVVEETPLKSKEVASQPAAPIMPSVAATVGPKSDVPQTNTAVAEVPEAFEIPRQRRQGYFDLTGFAMNQEYVGAVRGGLSVGLGWRPWKYFGVRGFGGVVYGKPGFYPKPGRSFDSTGYELFAGVEVELIPVYVSLFGMQDWLSVGVFGGASSLAYAPGSDPFTLPHGGIRTRVGMTDWLGLMAQVRLNKSFIQAETGLTFSF